MPRTIHQLAAAAALCAVSSLALAAPIPIVNAGFEDPYNGSGMPGLGEVPIGAFPVGPAPNGWTIYDEGAGIDSVAFVGVLNPGTAADGGTNFPGGADEGDNALLLYTDNDAGGARYGASQVLADSLQANTRYLLSVAVGNIASGVGLSQPWASFGFYNLDGFPGYTVQLLAGGVMLAEDTNGVAPGEGLWETTTVEFTTGAAHTQLGTNLEIRLINENQPDVPGVRGLEVDFDDVSLQAFAAVPEPLSVTLFAGGLLILGACAGNRRRDRSA